MLFAPLNRVTAVTVVLCGVGADTGNVRPVPAVDADGRFEYVPIPEKGATAESATYGTLSERFGDGPLAGLLDGVRPASDGDWVTDGAAVEQVGERPVAETLRERTVRG